MRGQHELVRLCLLESREFLALNALQEIHRLVGIVTHKLISIRARQIVALLSDNEHVRRPLPPHRSTTLHAVPIRWRAQSDASDQHRVVIVRSAPLRSVGIDANVDLQAVVRLVVSSYVAAIVLLFHALRGVHNDLW